MKLVHVFFLSLIFSELVSPHLDKFGLILFGLWGLVYLVKYKKTSFTYLECFFLLFIIYLLISVLFYEHTANTLMYVCLFFLQFGLLNYILIESNKDYFYFKKMFVLFVNWQTIVAFIGVVDFVAFELGAVSPIRDYIYSWKTDSFYSNPNPFGIMSAVALALVFSSRLNYGRIFLAVVIVINTLGVLISGSTTAIILPLIYYAMKSMVESKNTIMLVAVLVGVFILLSVGVTIDYDILFNKRLDIWGYGLEMWNASPYIGIGTGNFQLYNYLLPGNESLGFGYGLHSMYMWLLVETGVIGASLFLLFLLSCFYFLKKYRKTILLVPLLLLLLISQVTEFYLDHEEIFMLIFWLIMAAGVSRNKWGRDESKI